MKVDPGNFGSLGLTCKSLLVLLTFNNIPDVMILVQQLVETSD